MKSKKWIIITLAFSFVFIGSIILVNFIGDPFYQYRKPFFMKTYYGGNQRYKNPGFARNFDYSSVLTGSSMTENFLISELAKIMNDPIKLCVAGGTAFEINQILKVAFDAKNKIDTVMIGLDISSLSGDKQRTRFNEKLPLYLYDKNKLNDIKYLLNLTTTEYLIKDILRQFRKADKLRFEYEHMYQWQDTQDFIFDKDVVLSDWKKLRPKPTNKTNLGEWELQNLKLSFDYNYKSLIVSHPDTKFIIFFPPYSVLYWIDSINLNRFETELNIKSYIAKELSEYKNVILYDFQDDFNIVANLNLYKDYTHYHQKINSFMIQKIKEVDTKYIVVLENYNKRLENFKLKTKELTNLEIYNQ